MLTFKKGDSVKLLDENSKLIAILEADGWVCENKPKPKPKKKAEEPKEDK